MNTKLTLSLDKKRVEYAKRIAKKRGKTVSKIVEDYFEALKVKEEQIKKDDDPFMKEFAGMFASGSEDIFANLLDKKPK